ncbi:hypothetical protein B0H10DRAFT_2183888 [Mycena sp. CBHHK59/15]|nr:hypothetical protein B0H10DRAFT_2202037 [Mycena sp. CBHHK59/15]KAJ6630232.1 hypothetical protein B0H10DRAFT_2183888 [Mycena sp. CBHHK59/15]
MWEKVIVVLKRNGRHVKKWTWWKSTVDSVLTPDSFHLPLLLSFRSSLLLFLSVVSAFSIHVTYRGSENGGSVKEQEGEDLSRCCSDALETSGGHSSALGPFSSWSGAWEVRGILLSPNGEGLKPLRVRDEPTGLAAGGWKRRKTQHMTWGVEGRGCTQQDLVLIFFPIMPIMPLSKLVIPNPPGHMTNPEDPND